MTDLAIPAIPAISAIPAIPAPPPPPRFGAGMATAMLLLFVFAQMAVGIIVAIGGVIVTIARHGVSDNRALTAMFTELGPALILGSAVVAGRSRTSPLARGPGIWSKIAAPAASAWCPRRRGKSSSAS